PFTEAPWTVDEINGVGANSLDAFGIYAHDVKPPVLVTQIYAKVYPLGLIIGDADHPFTGQFDGKGHEISNLFIYRPPIEPTGPKSLVYLPRNAPDFIGLFPNVDDPAIIKNVGIVDCDITGRDVTGALIGSNTGEITSCHSSGSVTGGGYTGGLIGQNGGAGKVTGCHSSCTVTGQESYTSADDSFGGLVGYHPAGPAISQCYATGNIIAPDATSIGGLVGYTLGPVTDSYARGDVTGNYAGGLVGVNRGATTYCPN
ncbi:unnamed protein product, partial [marine sediment metagenome]